MKGRLQSFYKSHAWFLYYDALYGIHSALAFVTAEAAWAANPLVMIGVEPHNFWIKRA